MSLMNKYADDSIEKIRLSGKILRETREEMRSFVCENIPIIEVCEKAEDLIREKGANQLSPATFQ